MSLYYKLFEQFILRKKIQMKFDSGFSRNIGFLHVPKTGGTSIASLGKKLVRHGYSFPVVFGHGWTFDAINSTYPKMQLLIILRDPLERVISGYNSRLRNGRPQYNIPWTKAETKAFSLLPSSKHLLDAILADDPLSASKVACAFKNVPHLYTNYIRYFMSPEYVRAHKNKFALVGHINHFDHFLEDMANLSGIPGDVVFASFHKKHTAPESTTSVINEYNMNDIQKLRSFLSDEYAIYHELTKLLPEKVQEALPRLS